MPTMDLKGFTALLVVTLVGLALSYRKELMAGCRTLRTSLDDRVLETLMEPDPCDDRQLEADRLKPAHVTLAELMAVTPSSFSLSFEEQVRIADVVPQMDHYREHFGTLKSRVAELEEEAKWQGLPVEVLIREAYDQLCEEGIIE